MASTSSSASPLVSTVSSYDVFISCRGEDTRHSFTDHLYHKLVQAGIRTFRDDDEIDEGKKLKPELERAIKASKGSIVVISSNYATSTWCLDELWLILEQSRKCNHFVLPIFYHVDPSDVRKQEKTFNIKVKPSTRWTDDNVNRWKAALTEVSEMKGYVPFGSETDFIAKIVDKLESKLDMKLVSTAAHLTGMDTRAKVINSWLKNEQSGDDDVLAVCGMGGSGKTTLAQYIFNSNKQKFESSSFLSEIGKHYKQPDGMLGLQRQLLTDIFRGKEVNISNVFQGVTKIVEALKMKRVLIVLDDIDEKKELHELFGTEQFHTQSKIIITTRHRDIKAWFSSVSWSCQVHEIELLNDHESLELLSCHAFGSRIPMDCFMELAVKLAKYCEGSPLALEVLGSSLYVSAEEPQERNGIIEIWRSALNSLTSQEGGLDSKVQDVLRRSFNTLPLDSHKELFLHIACFFVGEYENYVVRILEHDWHAKSGIWILINRCLLTVSPSKKLMMHQLLQEMGRKIVHEESKDPAKRSRVWHDDDSYRVLQKGDGSGTIEGLALDARNLKGWTSYLSPRKTVSLAKMDKLKLLQLKYVKLTGSYKNFPELRWLCWKACHLKTIPTKLFMSSLVAMHMSHGRLKEFDPPVVLNSLKILNLKRSYNLVSIRNLWRLPNLEDLILWDCFSLKHVCKTIGDLMRLALLDLTGCADLLKVSFRKKCINKIALAIGGGIPQQMFSLPQSLEFLFLNECGFDDNNDVPVLFSGQPISYMNLGSNLYEFLPNNIDLKMVRALDLSYCLKMKSLLCLPSTLEELYTYSCVSLEKITFQSARFRLRTFEYEGCIKLSEIQGLFKLVSVAELDEADLGQMKWIKAYKDRKVDLIGDEITKHRKLRVQMLYEYGIMSTYVPGSIENQNMTASEYMSSSPFLSFHVPSKRRIQGLNVTLLYRRLSGNEDEDMLVLFAKISNTTKGLTWIYNPMLVCKPKVGEDVTWLSYWPIGNILDTGDEAKVSFIVGNAFTVRGCGASLQYMDGEVLEQEKYETDRKEEEVIGGDVSEFEVSRRGWYYLCRRDFFKSTSTTPDWFKTLFGDTIECTELQGRKNYRQLLMSYEELATFRCSPLQNYLTVVLKTKRHTCINKAPKAEQEASSPTDPTQNCKAAQSKKANPYAVESSSRLPIPYTER